MTDQPQLKNGLPATVETLSKLIEDWQPILWVGAGVSLAAGYPSTDAVLTTLRERALTPIDEQLDFTGVVDAFLGQFGRGALTTLLHELFSAGGQPTPVHHAIARLAATGRFACIVTTNYDNLIERVLQDAGVPHLVQVFESNIHIATEHVPVLKIHGDQHAWRDIVLSGQYLR